MIRAVRWTGQVLRGLAAALRARPGTFLGVGLGVLVLNAILPPLVLSLVRKPWSFFTFNPWLPNLPAFLASSEVPLQRKLEFVPNLALFWFNAEGPYGSMEWGYAVDVTDVLRFAAISVLFGAYFALWAHGRDRASQCAWPPASPGRLGQGGGAAGALASVVGLSTGPCSVVGCGAPVLPVVGLAFAGLSSGTLAWLATLSRASTPAILLALTLGVVYLSWRAGATTTAQPPPPPSPSS